MILNRETPHRMSRKVAGVMVVVLAIILPVAARSQGSEDGDRSDSQSDSQQPDESNTAKAQAAVDTSEDNGSKDE